MGYNDITASDNYIYALFSGKKKKECGSQSKIIRIIGWNGKAKCELESDLDLKQITVDKYDQVLYAIAVDENSEPEIVKFDLKSVFSKN